jgi:hypothetical protein
MDCLELVTLHRQLDGFHMQVIHTCIHAVQAWNIHMFWLMLFEGLNQVPSGTCHTPSCRHR